MLNWLVLAITGGLIVFIYVFLEIKRFRHKLTAFFLIGLILLFVISALVVFNGKEINYGSIDGAKTAGVLYFSWLKVIFVNLKTLTANAIHMDWISNKTES